MHPPDRSDRFETLVRMLEDVLTRLARMERRDEDIADNIDDLHRTLKPHGDGEPLHRRRGRSWR
jgi:hypothetical protein